MLKVAHFPRQARGLLLLSICLFILAALPARPASAVNVPQKVGDSLSEFNRGTFQRTSLSSIQKGASDLAGAVQLAPIGILKDWFDSPFLLPKKLAKIGAAAIGNHIFVVGGVTSVNNVQTRVADVWSTTIDPTTGAPLSAWAAETPLPAVKTTDVVQYSTPVAGRSLPAVTAVQTGPDSGYIYVIGGEVRPPLTPLEISSYAVNIGTVANGHITGWASSDTTTGLRIPADPTWGKYGLEAASAVSLATGGKTYVYLLGGLQRSFNGSVIQEAGTYQVFYAQVGANGMLVKPSSPGTPGWDTLAPIPFVKGAGLGPYAGLWDGTAVANHFDVGGGVGGDVLFMIGGQLQSDVGTGASNAYSAFVYRARIGNKGVLTWQQDTPQPALPTGRVGLGGVQFNGTLYLTGGRPATFSALAPDNLVQTSYVDDGLKLAQIGDIGSTFRGSPALEGQPRASHGTVVVAAAPTAQSPNAAYVYVIAGQGADGLGSDTLIYGKIGTSEDTTATGFAGSGWYYSAPHATGSSFNGEQVQRIDWTTLITHPADIQMQYRISTFSNCDDPAAFGSSTWTTLDGSPSDGFSSVNGANSQSLPSGLLAHCFQYRARLTTTGDGATTTPSLLNVSILVYVPGSPDLKVSSINVLRSSDGKNKLTGLTVTILNQNLATDSPTLPADVESSQPNETFYVDLCVFAPGDTPTPPVLPLSDSNPQCSDAYAEIPKSSMGKDIALTITQWCKTRPENGCQSIDLLTLFAKPGDYTVYAAVDSYNYVPETPAPAAEQNNVLSKTNIHVDVGGIAHQVLLPIIARKP